MKKKSVKPVSLNLLVVCAHKLPFTYPHTHRVCIHKAGRFVSSLPCSICFICRFVATSCSTDVLYGGDIWLVGRLEGLGDHVCHVSIEELLNQITYIDPCIC